MSCSRAAHDGWAWCCTRSVTLSPSCVLFLTLEKKKIAAVMYVVVPRLAAVWICLWKSKKNLVSLWTYELWYSPKQPRLSSQPGRSLWDKPGCHGDANVWNMAYRYCFAHKHGREISFWVDRNRQTKTWASVQTSIRLLSYEKHLPLFEWLYFNRATCLLLIYSTWTNITKVQHGETKCCNKYCNKYTNSLKVRKVNMFVYFWFINQLRERKGEVKVSMWEREADTGGVRC